MHPTRLTLQRVRDRGLTVELLYGGLDLYRYVTERAGVASARELARAARGSTSPHPCERALRLLSSFVEPVLDGAATWEQAKQHLDRLEWQQNGN